MLDKILHDLDPINSKKQKKIDKIRKKKAKQRRRTSLKYSPRNEGGEISKEETQNK